MVRVALVALVAVVFTHAAVNAQEDEPPVIGRSDEPMLRPSAIAPTVGGSRSPAGNLQVVTSQRGQNKPPGIHQTAVSQPLSPSIPAPRSADRNWSNSALKANTGSLQAGIPAAPADGRVRRTQTTTPAITQLALPDMGLPTNSSPVPAGGSGGQSISLQAALYGALTSNPDLVTLRQGNAQVASAESVEVARHFPTTLNPTLWIDYRPITLVPNGTFGSGTPGGHTGSPGANGFYHYGQGLIYVSLRQPIELGHQTTHRYRIAQAAYQQQKWVIVQAELTALVQTYRFFQTAAYRREKFYLARELANFNDQLSETLQRRMETNPALAADVSLARVESRASRQQIKAARQDYLTALADLRNQVGIPEQAGAIEPLGEFTLPPYIPPLDEQVMIHEALENRPDIQAASAQVAGTHSAVDLARSDRIPTPVFGPQYEMDEAGVQYIGFVLISSVPVWNNGKPLMLQREAEHRRAVVAFQQAQQRAIAQVRAAVAKWNGARELLSESTDLSTDLRKEVNVLDRLFEAGQTDLTKLMQARQRLIQLENSRLDAVWAATQAQADLLLSLGVPSLINAMLNRVEPAVRSPASISSANTAKADSTMTSANAAAGSATRH
jgi:cobalt-zinc-cadmium efflux system outer membrane protein